MNDNIDELHPNHAKALRIARLTPKKFPSFKEILTNINDDEQQSKTKNKKKNRTTHFCVGAT